jgi:hypothetical protein
MIPKQLNSSVDDKATYANADALTEELGSGALTLDTSKIITESRDRYPISETVVTTEKEPIRREVTDIDTSKFPQLTDRESLIDRLRDIRKELPETTINDTTVILPPMSDTMTGGGFGGGGGAMVEEGVDAEKGYRINWLLVALLSAAAYGGYKLLSK